MDIEQASAMFKALGHPERLRIFRFLQSCCEPVAVDDAGSVRRLKGPTAGEVCCHITGIETINSTISNHIRELRLAGLITVERRGKNMICGINSGCLSVIEDLLDRGDVVQCEADCCEGEKDARERIPLIARDDVREIVRAKYGEAARIVLEGRGEACCGTGNVGTGKKVDSCCGDAPKRDAITSNLYSDADAAGIPEDALLASLGCGNPTALAQLSPGEIVLDLGSGGGIDVLLSASRVGPTGFAYGLDMTDDMLALAERNKQQAGAENVSFLKGCIEQIPLPDNSVDVVISNCVINLSSDKDAVFREAYRVLKPGGRIAISDVVVDSDIPSSVRKDMESYVGCVAGALDRADYLAKLAAAGFVDGSIEPTRRYTFADLEDSGCSNAAVSRLSDEERKSLHGRIFSGFIRATRAID